MAELFRRVEKKYILTTEEFELIMKEINKHMIPDEYGKSNICNIYFDSYDYALVQNSISKPIYKDKVRLRSYNTPKLSDMVFLEIKRKFDEIVSKRRIGISLSDFYNYIENPDSLIVENMQIKKELDYYFRFFKLRPTMYVSYDRVAFYDPNDRDFRITFDNNILARNYDLFLENGSYGNKIINSNKYIMEVKTLGSMPFWLIKVLNEFNISPAGFSKYGEGYTQLILKANSYDNLVI